MYTDWTRAQEELKSGVTLLMFKTDWCNDCKMIQLMLDEELKKWSSEGISNFKVTYVNAEDSGLFRKETGDYPVPKIPSFFVVKDGKPEHLGIKFVPMELIKSKIVEALK